MPESSENRHGPPLPSQPPHAPQTLQPPRLTVPILLLTALIEGVTALFRFGFKLESTRDTAGTVGRLTFGLRIHHGYIGLLLVLIALGVLPRQSEWRYRLLVLGAALAASDAVHHFLVLWPVTGSPQFDLWYPAP